MVSQKYWIVAGDESRVWSYGSKSYVSTDDAVYVAWRVANVPTRIASESELCDVLNGDLIAEIAVLEQKQLRPLREIQLGADVTANEGRLSSLDDEIVALRVQLHSVPLT